MARVILIGTMTQLTGGIREVEIEAATIAQVLRGLYARFPALGDNLADSVAVAIDGQIFQDDLIQPIPPDAEVHILPKIAGG
jgi:molybdopterin converting factor small subunit